MVKDAEISIENITIRTEIKPGDLGFVIHRHGALYAKEYNYGVPFEMYVAKGLAEFYQLFDAEKDRAWICEYNNRIVGFLLLMHRENNAAQLRYFYLDKEYRGIGLGKKLMSLFMEFYKNKGYSSSYLLTTEDLHAAISLYTRHGFVLVEEMETNSFGKTLKERKYELKSRKGIKVCL